MRMPKGRSSASRAARRSPRSVTPAASATRATRATATTAACRCRATTGRGRRSPSVRCSSPIDRNRFPAIARRTDSHWPVAARRSSHREFPACRARRFAATDDAWPGWRHSVGSTFATPGRPPVLSGGVHDRCRRAAERLRAAAVTSSHHIRPQVGARSDLPCLSVSPFQITGRMRVPIRTARQVGSATIRPTYRDDPATRVASHRACAGRIGYGDSPARLARVML